MDGLMHLLRVLSSTSHIKICDFIHSSSQRSLQYPSNWYCYYITCFYCIGQQFFLTFLLYIWEMDKCMLKQRANRFSPLVFLRSVFGWNTSKFRTFIIAATRTHKRSSFSKCCSLASHQHTHHLNFSLIQPLVLPHWFSLMIGGGCIHTCSCYGEWSLQYTEELCHGLYLCFLIQRSSIKLQLHCSSTKMLKYADLCCLWWPEI